MSLDLPSPSAIPGLGSSGPILAHPFKQSNCDKSRFVADGELRANITTFFDIRAKKKHNFSA
jgi:hypothetical protein